MEAIMWLRVMLKNRMKMKLYCSLFPSDYDFDRDTLVELWMAMGFLRKEVLRNELFFIRKESMEDTDSRYFDNFLEEEYIQHSRIDSVTRKTKYKESMEDTGSRYFDNFLEEEYIQHSRIDSVTRKTKYKVNFDMVAALSNGNPTIKDKERYIILDDENEITADKSKSCYVSVVSKNVNQNMLKTLMTFHNLRTLLFIRNYRSSVKQIPSAMFLALQSIEALDLSGSDLIELPSSIGNLRLLRYLDLSFTLIESLPESIDRLRELQTLKLRGCKNLYELPKNIKELTHLRHLDFDILGQLTSMPKGIGALTELRTLCAFIVDPEGICSLRELRYMNNLSGSCCISGLENVSHLMDVAWADLRAKRNLAQLQLRWNNYTRYADSDRKNANKFIDLLQPNSKSLQDLQISYYPGSELPSWVRRFEELTSITLLHCENTQFCMSLGLSSTIKNLNIVHMDRLTTIADHYHRSPRYNERAFHKLEELVIDGMLCLETWTGVEKRDFSRLSKFIMKQCPKLTTLPFLAWLRSLRHLEITQCTMLESLPEKPLSTSVQTLIIDDCPLLKMRCSKGAEDWHKIKHVPHVWIDLEDMHSTTEDNNSTSGSLSDNDSDYNGTFDINDIQPTPWREDDANSLGNDAI